jgi:hypothetical protein
MEYWFDDVRVLFDYPLEFFPVQASRERRLNALVRLIFYCAVIIALMRRSFLPIVSGCVLIVVATILFWRKRERDVYILEKNNPVCRKPNIENPMANTPVTDIGTSAALQCVDANETSGEFLDKYIYSDTADVYANEFAVRPYTSLPNGGAYPDFSELAESLKPTASVSMCSSM